MPSLLFMDTLARVGLPRLAPMLDRVLRWDQDLNWGDQQELVLASADPKSVLDVLASRGPSRRG